VLEIGELSQLRGTPVARLFQGRAGHTEYRASAVAPVGRSHTTLRILESFVQRVHRRMTVR
jgi:hypothetical protein